jgi:hypothetical protein
VCEVCNASERALRRRRKLRYADAALLTHAPPRPSHNHTTFVTQGGSPTSFVGEEWRQACDGECSDPVRQTGRGDGVRVDRHGLPCWGGRVRGRWPPSLLTLNTDLIWDCLRAGPRVRVALAQMEALMHVVLLLSAAGVPRASAWCIAHEKGLLEKQLRVRTRAAIVFQKFFRARLEFLLYKCCARIGWYRALPGVPAFVNHRGYMYAHPRHLFTVGLWRVYWRHCLARGRFILCLPNLVWPASWLDRAYLCETEIADQYPHYFPPCTGSVAAGDGALGKDAGAAPATSGPVRSIVQPKWSLSDLSDVRILWPTVLPCCEPHFAAVARSCSPSTSDTATAAEIGHVSSSDQPRARA